MASFELEIVPDAVRTMVRHALEQAPLECCGLLAGVGTRATHVYPLRNERASPTAYRAEATDLFAALRDMRAQSIELVAIYHSHPSSPALPSATDLRENYYDDLPRVIVSLTSRPPVVRAFRLFADRYDEIALPNSAIS